MQSKPLGDGFEQILERIACVEDAQSKRFEAIAVSLASLHSLIDQ